MGTAAMRSATIMRYSAYTGFVVSLQMMIASREVVRQRVSIRVHPLVPYRNDSKNIVVTSIASMSTNVIVSHASSCHCAPRLTHRMRAQSPQATRTGRVCPRSVVMIYGITETMANSDPSSFIGTTQVLYQVPVAQHGGLTPIVSDVG